MSPNPVTSPRLADSRSGPEPRLLRQVLRHVPTSVTVVCTFDGDHPVGHTIGSFVSASLDPPLVGYFAMRSSGTLAAVRRSGRFSVNVLGEHQVELGRRFADRSGEPFDGVRWEAGAHGCPHLDGVLAVLDCDVEQVVTVGDHELVIGRVVGTTVAPGGPDPLVFARGRFRTLGGRDVRSRGPGPGALSGGRTAQAAFRTSRMTGSSRSVFSW